MLSEERWPRPKYDENDEPHFLFIITPPFSGSTALTKLLNSSNRTMTLQERGEAQWLLPGLCEKDRWDPQKKIDMKAIKAVWLNKYQEVKRLTQSDIDVVIEKSPPNMMRMSELTSHFKNFSIIANNRDPYANCASMLYRGHGALSRKGNKAMQMAKDADGLTLEQRKKLLGGLIRNWLLRSKKVQALVKEFDAPLLTYEDFCEKPSSVLDALSLPRGVADTINPDASVKVKDYKSQPIISQNDRQISKLSDEELNFISESLADHHELLAFFGYRCL